MKKKILFIFRHEYESIWRDGLWKALQLLSYDYEITFHNLIHGNPILLEYDFVLGWGAFGSAVDSYMQTVRIPKGLCIAGNARPPVGADKYNVLFYETEWYRPVISSHPNIVHAFGINSSIYKKEKRRKVWNYITVGAFADWKRQHLLGKKNGMRLAIGEIQKGNLSESLRIVSRLLADGVFVSDMVDPRKLAELYNLSETLYMPSNIFGGGERSVLEARACDLYVEIEEDNPKLQELLTCPIWDEHYYCDKLKEGISNLI